MTSLSIPQPNLLQRMLSWFAPVKIYTTKSIHNPVLGLYLFRGRWQLVTYDAMYSDGVQYRPLRIAFERIQQQLPHSPESLFLGCGLASGPAILHRMGFRGASTMVDLDGQVLTLARHTMPRALLAGMHWVESDAQAFVSQDQHRYDLLAIDIFIGQIVPAFAIETAFLAHCAARLKPAGTLVMNYIFGRPEDYEQLNGNLRRLFDEVTLIRNDINLIFIAKP